MENTENETTEYPEYDIDKARKILEDKNAAAKDKKWAKEIAKEYGQVFDQIFDELDAITDIEDDDERDAAMEKWYDDVEKSK